MYETNNVCKVPEANKKYICVSIIQIISRIVSTST